MSQLVASLNFPPLAGARFELCDVTSARSYSVSNLSMVDTEQLLDWLENHGVTGCDCSPQADGSMTVRWNMLK